MLNEQVVPRLPDQEKVPATPHQPLKLVMTADALVRVGFYIGPGGVVLCAMLFSRATDRGNQPPARLPQCWRPLSRLVRGLCIVHRLIFYELRSTRTCPQGPHSACRACQARTRP
jgi:hypothetical protein